jgi:hypothetical protein
MSFNSILQPPLIAPFGVLKEDKQLKLITDYRELPRHALWNRCRAGFSCVNFYFFESHGIAINYHSRFACTLYLWQFHIFIQGAPYRKSQVQIVWRYINNDFFHC